MRKLFWIFTAALLTAPVTPVAFSKDSPGTSKTYKALRYTPPASTFGTWGILDRDGANRKVEPYLSSLAQGEMGTGTIVSPAFSIGSDRITFTICGHDGQGGGQKKNFIALVNSKTGQVLRKTLAPGSDPLQERSWDVKDLKKKRRLQVRIEVRDGMAAGAFAWLGIGSIDAGPSLKIDFRKGVPEEWEASQKPRKLITQQIRGGIPFRALRQTMVPNTGAVEIPCGFSAKRLFTLGCTVFRGRPAEVHGHIEIQYRSGPPDRYPLMVGYTLEGDFKLLSKSKAMHLHPSGDPFQYYLVMTPRKEIIEKIKLERNPRHPAAPFISAITCETGDTAETLEPLPDCSPGAGEMAWIRSHAISKEPRELERIVAEIRRAHKIKM